MPTEMQCHNVRLIVSVNRPMNNINPLDVTVVYVQEIVSLYLFMGTARHMAPKHHLVEGGLLANKYVLSSLALTY